MIKKIVGGIAKQIFSEFGKDSVVYSEDVKQNFKKPCFVIKLVKTYCQNGIGGRKKFVNSFVIQYFPKEKNVNLNINSTAKRLFDCLEFIDAGRIIRGTNMKAEKSSPILLNNIGSGYENSDGILCFFVNYDFHQIFLDEDYLMENLFINNKN